MKKLALLLCSVLLLFSGCAKESETVLVNVEIDCSEILSNYENLDENLRSEKYVPENGIILEKTQVEANVGDSALDVLKKICKENDIMIDADSGYAKGINYIYEKSCGSNSGWIYEVNNEPIMTEYTVSEGDLISWIYICDFSTMSFE